MSSQDGRRRGSAYRLVLFAVGFALLAQLGAARASMVFCERPPELTALQQHRLLSFAALIRRSLDDGNGRAALIARSGMDMADIGVRYTHAGISLRDNANTRWSVRQLYFACDEGRPRLFDQGLSGFLLGLAPDTPGFISIVTLPAEAQQTLADAALDNRLALNLLSATYSANAYPFSTAFQNCNQWVAEVLATALGGLARQPDDPALRERAQQWLIDSDYQPSVFQLASPLHLWASAFVPWIHHRDHPPEARDALRFKVSMPRSIEQFVEARVPGATRTEFCLKGSRVVVRRGWQRLPADCEPADGDVVTLID